MKARKSLALILSAAMLLSMLSLTAFAAEGEGAPALADAADSWAAGSIDRWVQLGVVKGDANGNFNPANPLSRGELATILVNMFGLTEKAENTYADLKGDEWYADAILKCTAAGIMKGDGASCNATAQISRQETMVMFGRAVGVTPAEEPDMSKFTDADDVADWAAGYMAPLAEMGIITGVGDGSVAPAANIDRASMMALLDKAVAEYVNAPGEVAVDNANGFVIVNVPAAEGEVVLTGSAAGVVVAAGTTDAKVVAKDLTADTVKVDGAAPVSVEGKSEVGTVAVNAAAEVEIAKTAKADTLEVNAPAEVTNNGTVKTLEVNDAAKVSNTGTVTNLNANAPAEVSNTGKVTNLTANDAVKVDNQGTITKAEVKADDVVLDGKKPSTVTVDKDVENPTNSKGEEVKPSKPSTGGSTGPYYSTRSEVSEAPLVDANGTPIANLTSTYSVTGQQRSDRDYVEVAVTATDLVMHENGNHQSGFWVGVQIAHPADVVLENATAASGWTQIAAPEGSLAENRTSYTDTGSTFYFNAASAAMVDGKGYITIDWDGNEGSSAPVKYVVDLSGVTSATIGRNETTAFDFTIPTGMTLTVPAEKTLTIDSGKKLVINGTLNVEGTLVNNGTIEGVVTGTGTIPDALTSFSAGKGTADAPYEIATAAQFMNIGKLSSAMQSGASYSFKLTADIDLADASNKSGELDVSGYFRGTLDGNGKTLKAYDKGYTEVFSRTLGAVVIKNLNIEQNTHLLSLIWQSGNGDPTATTLLENITVTSKTGTTASIITNNVTSFVHNGFGAELTLRNCTNRADINAGSHWTSVFVGGFGNRNGNDDGQATALTLENCVNEGTLTGDYVSLFVGNDNWTGTNCSVTVSGCSNTGKVTGAKYADYFDMRRNVQVLQTANAACADIGNVERLTMSGLELTAAEGQLKITDTSGKGATRYEIYVHAAYGTTDGSDMISIKIPVATDKMTATGVYVGTIVSSDAQNVAGMNPADWSGIETVAADGAKYQVVTSNGDHYYVVDKDTMHPREYSDPAIDNVTAKFTVMAYKDAELLGSAEYNPAP